MLKFCLVKIHKKFTKYVKSLKNICIQNESLICNYKELLGMIGK